MNTSVLARLPCYQCHKQVWAMKIDRIQPVQRPTIDELQELLETGDNRNLPQAILYSNECGLVKVSDDYMRKHEPKVGGYYVVYKDGYESFSPADAFEDGYTRCVESPSQG